MIKVLKMLGLALILIGGLMILSDFLSDMYGITLFVLPFEVSTTMIFGCFIAIWGAILWLKYGE